MKNGFIRLLAVSALVVACNTEPEQPAFPEMSADVTTLNIGADGATTPVAVTTNRSFSIVCDESWLAFDPEYAEVEAGVVTECVINVTALPTNVGGERTAEFTIKCTTEYIKVTVVQAGDPTKMPFDIYSNNFDAEAAANNNGWPYLDTFNGWRNQTGSGVTEALTYYGSGVTVRSNSVSNNGTYSLYSGSGSNNFFFGTGGWFAIGNIALHQDHRSLILSFGTEKYAYGVSDNTFKPEEFPVYVSVDGNNWVSVDYTFATNTWPDGQWDLATARFTLPEAAEYLYVRFAPTIASAHRLDDVSITATAETVGEVIDWSTGTSYTLESPISPAE